MKVTFIEKHSYKVDIDFEVLKRCVKNSIEKIMPDDREIDNEMIYSAFAKNPEYYLTHLGYLSKSSEVADNYSVIKTIEDRFFIYCMNNAKPAYYVLKGGEMLAKYEDQDMAKLYAHRMDGYIIKVD